MDINLIPLELLLEEIEDRSELKKWMGYNKKIYIFFFLVYTYIEVKVNGLRIVSMKQARKRITSDMLSK